MAWFLKKGYDSKKKKKEKEVTEYNERQEKLDAKYKTTKQKLTFKSLMSHLKFETYTKRIVGIIVFVGLCDLQLSYVLAFMNKYQVVENLSNTICTTILGTVLVYMIRAYFDTKAEKRDEFIKLGLMDGNSKKYVTVSKEVLESKLNEVIQNSGLGLHIDGSTTQPNTDVDNTTTLQPENPDDSSSVG